MSSIRTILTAKRFGRDGELLDVRRDYSHSFTRHFIEGLYLSHAQILTGAPLVVTDVILSTTRSVDCDTFNSQTPAYSPKANLQLAGPSGRGAATLSSGLYFSGTPALNTPVPSAKMAGHTFGIVIGRGNTAVTPADNQLVDRIHHGTGASVGAPVVIEQLNAGDTTDITYASNNGLIGMVYTPLRSVLMSTIQFKCFRTGNPGNVTANVVGISNGAAGGVYPDTTVLATSNVVNANLWGAASPGAFVTFTFAAPVTLLAGFTYFIYITPSQVSAGNAVNIRGINTNVAGRQAYTFGTALGAIFATFGSTYQILYIITGTCGAEMEYGATDIYGLIVNGGAGTSQFTMRRIFQNNSGEAITVQEAGIYLPLTRYWSGAASNSLVDYNTFMVCAARDVVAPGIAVANGESIEIDYTPSIAV